MQNTFDDADALNGWVTAGKGSSGIEDGVLHVTASEAEGRLLRLRIPAEPYRGARVLMDVRARAQDVAVPPESYQGVKAMIQTEGPSGPTYASQTQLWGSFGWRPLPVSSVVPADAEEIVLVLGIEATTGEVWFDDLTFEVTAMPRTRPEQRPEFSQEKLDRRTDVPRLRGVMYGPAIKEQDLRDLADWGGNVIRYHMYYHGAHFPETRLDLERYDEWLVETMAELDGALPLFEELGIKVVIDLHTPPGGGVGNQWELFADARYQQYFIQAWDRLAERYKDEPAVWGYDLANEPPEGAVAEGLMDWRTLAEHVARRVRKIDPHKAIFIAPGPAGGWGNLPYFEPIDVPGIIYTVHVYDPLEFTHQGVFAQTPTGVKYPGMINGELWDRERLRQELMPVREFQLDYGVPVFIGEFSAPRWAPGAAEYLRDAISIFEEFGWDWTYHSFRNYHVWEVELVAEQESRELSPVPTDRMKALQDGFSKNAGDDADDGGRREGGS
ncbi:MAG: glycoside hydrolase family 5 protein [Phycisphaerae bacterium]